MMRIAGRIMAFVLCSALIAAATSTASAKQKVKECQILDQYPEAVYEFDFGYIPDSDVEHYGSTDMIEVNGDWACAYYRTGGGDIDLNLRGRSTIFRDTLDGIFPSQVSKVAIDAGWAARSGRGTALQMRIQPGIYSDFNDLSGDSFAYPFSLALIRAFDPSLSAIAGIEIRPDFDLPIMPLIGVVWEINSDFKLDLRCPQSKATYYISRGWNTYLGLNWENTTYEVAGGADRLTVDYYKVYWGIMHQMSNQAIVRAEIGDMFQRSVRFEDLDTDPDREVDIDGSMFLRVGMGAAF